MIKQRDGSFELDGLENDVILTSKGFVNIFRDDYAEHPDNLFDFLFEVISFDRYYPLGYNEFDDRETFLKETKSSKFIRYSLDINSYSGKITLDDTFDEKSCFFAYVEKEKLYKEYNTKKITKSILDKALSCLNGELEMLANYFEGNVYGIEFLTLKEEGYMGGFYGNEMSKNGICDYVGEIFLTFPARLSEKLYEWLDDFPEIEKYNSYSKEVEKTFIVDDLGGCVEIKENFSSNGEIFSKDNFLLEVFENEEKSSLMESLKKAVTSNIERLLLK